MSRVCFLKEGRVVECLTSRGRFVSDVRTEVREKAKAMSFAGETSEFEYACV